jgi:hypothetical protein
MNHDHSIATKRTRTLLLVAAAIAGAGCHDITGLFSGDCTTILVPAVSVAVLDSITGLAIENGSTARARDGSFVDSMVVSSDTTGNAPYAFPIPLAYERAGVYQVSVSRAGYRDWSTSNIRVTKATCHVRTATLVAKLVRAP